MNLLLLAYLISMACMSAMVFMLHLLKRSGGIKYFWPVITRDILLYVVLWPISFSVIGIVGWKKYSDWENKSEIALYKLFKRGLF